MRNWRRRTRAQHTAKLYAWYNSDSRHDKKHESKYVLSQIRKGNWDNSTRGLSQWQAWWSPIWRSRNDRQYKADAKHVRDGLAAFAKYPYYEDCRYHVCKQTKVEVEGHGRIGIEGESLINGTFSNCSYEHCGIVHLTKEEGEARAQFVKDMGMMPYQLKYVYGIPQDRDKLEQSLRYSLGQERVWNFNKNGGTQEITDQGKEWLLNTVQIVYDDLKPMEAEEMAKALEAGND
jgi:hypothetical protein